QQYQGMAPQRMYAVPIPAGYPPQLWSPQMMAQGGPRSLGLGLQPQYIPLPVQYLPTGEMAPVMMPTHSSPQQGWRAMDPLTAQQQQQLLNAKRLQPPDSSSPIPSVPTGPPAIKLEANATVE